MQGLVMAMTDAQVLLDRIQTDQALAERVKGAASAGGTETVLTLLRAEGFEVTPDNVREALVERYGDRLTQEQLDALAGGAFESDWDLNGYLL